MRWEFVLGLLPFLILLVCPLHMWWMMRHRSHGESCGTQRNAEGDVPKVDVAPADGAEQEIRRLSERIARLEMEQRYAKELWK